MASSHNIPNHLVCAILSTIFCCLPLGIVSIVFAAKVDGLVSSGDIAGAQAASNNAKKWAISRPLSVSSPLSSFSRQVC